MESQSQIDMIKSMIDKGLTLPSNKKGHFETFRQLSEAQIYNLLIQCSTQAKLDLSYSNEPIYYLMRDARIVLVSATAGAGKTTLTCMKVDREIRLKGTDPTSICMLSFNNDSVSDIKSKMKKIMDNNNLVTRRFGIIVDEKYLPNIRSLNSLTYNIVDQYKDYWHIAKVDIITAEDATLLMSKVINAVSLDNGGFEVTTKLVADCLSLYDLVNETMSDIDSIKNYSLVVETHLSISLLKKIISSYSSHLMIQNKFHHSDTARLILERCEVDEDFRHSIENMYELIVVDELQDISESMFRLLKIMVNTKNRLIAIGDGDQSIYGFKGARQDTCFKFKEDFPEAELCTLSVNRRCAEQILEYAKAVIKNVSKRIPQELKAINNGGIVDINYYNDSKDVIKYIAEYLNNIPKNHLGNLCIGFRKNVTCYFIAQKLMEEGIPFRVKPDMMPGTDKLSNHLKEIFAMLKSPSNINLALQNLYKVLPIKKTPHNDFSKVLVNIEEALDESGGEYFYEIPIEELPVRGLNQNAVAKQMQILEQASSLVRKKGTMKEIMSLIFPLFEKNFWNFTRSVSSFQPELESLVIETYSQDETYVEFQHRRKEMFERIQRYMSKGYGIKLSSFHSLKGLEFDEVFLVELDADNLPLIHYNDSITEEEIKDLVDEELRLFYVATTRAKQKLHLFWSESNKSVFDQINKDFLNHDTAPQLDTNLDDDDDGEILVNFDFDDTQHQDTQLTDTTQLDTDTTQHETTQLDTNLDDDEILVNFDFDDNDTAQLDDDNGEILVNFDFDDTTQLDFDDTQHQDTQHQDTQHQDTQHQDVQPDTQHSTSQHKTTTHNNTILNLSNIEDYNDLQDESTIHIREDFVDVTNGNELQNILKFVCTVQQPIKEVSQ